MRHMARVRPTCPKAWTAAIALVAVLGSNGAPAHGVFTVNQPWVKPGERTSEAYMILMSSEAAKLTHVRSSVAERAGLRGKGSDVRAIALPAGRTVTLKPGAERIALFRLAHPLKLGDRVPLVLTVEAADGARQEIAVDAEVRNEWPVDAELRAHRH
jgi:copper(I)-binding protein